MKTKVSELLKSKGSDIISVKTTQTVYEATELMAENNIGCVLVLKRDGSLAGICSERDVFRKVILAHKHPEEIQVRSVMTPLKKMITVTPASSVGACMELMTSNRVRHLPVLKRGGALVGVISIGDLVKTITSDQSWLIDQLEHYIEGSL